MSEPQPSEPSASFPRGEPIGFLGIIGITVGVLSNLVDARLWSNGEITGEVQGYAIGGILCNSFIAYLIAGRKKNRNWNRFGVWFAALSLIFLFFELRSKYWTA